jgi:hypothetical protein
MFKTKEPKVLGYESKVHYSNELQPMLKVVPEWYKKMPRKITLPYTGKVIQTAKACFPFLDALTAGYSICLTQDILVERTPEGPVFRYVEKQGAVGARPIEQTSPMPAPLGCGPESFTWQTEVSIKLPKGYSAIYTHPFNRFDLPFVTITAIVDHDGVISGGNSPFYLKEGWSGLIKKGTPITQVIPFLREDWKSKEINGVVAEGAEWDGKEPHDWYKKLRWHRKMYK